MSSIFTKMKHAFEHLGHDIEKVAKSVAHGVENVAKKIGHDLVHVMQDALELTEALMMGNMKLAMQDLAKLGSDLEKTAVDTATATSEAALHTLGDLHLGKGFDKLIGDVEKGLDTAKDALNKGTDAGLHDLVNSAEGLVVDTLHAVKDLAHGDIGAMLTDLGHVGEDALNLAADLTPEGMGATIAASTLSALHVGNDAINGALVGLMHGNVGKVVHSAVELGVNTGTTLLNNGGGDAVLTGAMLLAAVPPGGGGKRGKHGATHGTKYSEKYQEPSKGDKKDHKTDDKKSDKKDDKKSDKKDDKKDDDNGNSTPKLAVLPVTNDAFTRNIKKI